MERGKRSLSSPFSCLALFQPNPPSTPRKRCWQNFQLQDSLFKCTKPDCCNLRDSDFKIPRLDKYTHSEPSSSFSCNNGREHAPSPFRDSPSRKSLKRKLEFMISKLDNALISYHNKHPFCYLTPLLVFKASSTMVSTLPIRAEIESAASFCTTPYLSLIKDPIPCHVNIKVADGKVISKETVVVCMWLFIGSEI